MCMLLVEETDNLVSCLVVVVVMVALPSFSHNIFVSNVDIKLYFYIVILVNIKTTHNTQQPTTPKLMLMIDCDFINITIDKHKDHITQE